MSKKILLLVFSLLCCYTSNLFAQSGLPDEKRVVFVASEQPIKDAIKELSKKSGVNIAFKDELLSDDDLVNVVAKGKPVGQILDHILEGTELKYRIIGNQIVLEQDVKALAESDEATISGYVYDSNTGETLPYANIYTHDKVHGASANAYGFYSINIPTGEAHLYCSYTAYKVEINDFDLLSDTIIDFSLIPNTKLNEVVIIDAPTNIEPRSVASIEVPIQKIASMVPLAGEADLVRFAQMSPGVSFGSDGFGGLSVRGGNIEHNLFLLDGVPMYDINHSLGLFSVFNNYAVKNAVLYKGATPAKFGGRLSSVLDIRTKEGNSKKLAGEVGIGTLAAKATLEGPIGDKASFIISGRRTIIDPFISSLSQATRQSTPGKEGATDYNFYDVFAKLNVSLTKKSRLYFTFFNGGDKFLNEEINTSPLDNLTTETRDEFSFDSGNTLFAVKWNYQKNKNAFLKFNAYLSNYKLEVFENLSLQRYDQDNVVVSSSFDSGLFDSGILDLGFQFDAEKIAKSGNILTYGAHVISHNFKPGNIIANEFSMLVFQGTIPSQDELQLNLDNAVLGGLEARLYGQYDIDFGENNILSLGLNQALYKSSVPSTWYAIPEPRLNLLFKKSRSEVRFGVNRMSQFSHRISTTSLGWPLDIWVPSTSRIRPQSSWLFSGGATRSITANTSIGVAVFASLFSNLVTYNSGNLIEINNDSDWDLLLPVGKGKSYGVEFSWQKDVGKLLMEANYSISLTDRTYEDINLGNTFPYRFDRRHFVKTNLLYRINTNAEVALNWMYGSGTPVSVPSFVSLVDGELVIIFDEINGSKLKPFHRLDFGFNFYNKYEWGRMKFNIGAYNAYNRNNTHYLEVIPRNGGEIRDYSFLGVTPSISVSLQF